MGYSTQEFTSSNLTNMYPAYYEEFQVVNWAHTDIVLTKSNGAQFVLAKSAQPVREQDACIILESRSYNGLRVQLNSSVAASHSQEIQVPAKRYHVLFESLRNAPIRIEECDCILSTVEQSMIAKNMACEINFSPMLNENRTDAGLIDPRLVFQVIDPANQFDALLVNVFGQTIILRAGTFGQVIPTSMPDVTKSFERGRLICYLRYPTEYYSGAKTKQIVFDIALDDIYKKEPFRLPSGDLVCVATNMDDLREIVAKKAECSTSIVTSGSISELMIPKEVFEAAEANHKAELARVKEDAKNRLESLAARHANEVSKLQSELLAANQAKDAAEAKSKQWEALNEANTTFRTNEQKIAQEAEKTRKEANDNARRDIEHMWTVLKIGGGILTSVASFAVTVLVKSKK